MSRTASISRDTAAVAKKRLKNVKSGALPWLSTMTTAELSLSVRHGIKPLSIVTGACRMQNRFSWTMDHTKGWNNTLGRLRAEAKILGANAVVDVTLRSTRVATRYRRSTMDFAAIGTAIRIEGLPPSKEPLIADIPALELTRLLAAGIVPTGIAIGAVNRTLSSGYRSLGGEGITWNKPLLQLGGFWAKVKRAGWKALADDAAGKGTHVLAHTQRRQLIERRRNTKGNSAQYFGQQVAIGTVLDTGNTNLPIPAVRTVVDMRDDESPLKPRRRHNHNTYPIAFEQELA